MNYLAADLTRYQLHTQVCHSEECIRAEACPTESFRRESLKSDNCYR
jgi:hypothetical protein